MLESPRQSASVPHPIARSASSGKDVQACTTILVGKGATADGSVLLATSCDGNMMGRTYVQPARDFPSDAKVQMFYDFPAPSTWEEHEAQMKEGYTPVGHLPIERAYRCILAAGHRYQIPVTVHVAIGQDIIHEHANFDPAATARATYADFLVLTETVMNLEGGVFMNFGTAVMGPEVYLKALAMARNVAHQRGEEIAHFHTAVFDLLPLEGEDLTKEAPKDTPGYYFRPWKTILVRTVADGGESIYVQGDHAETFPTLYHHVNELRPEC